MSCNNSRTSALCAILTIQLAHSHTQTLSFTHKHRHTHFHPFIKQIFWGMYSVPGTGCVCVTPGFIGRWFGAKIKAGAGRVGGGVWTAHRPASSEFVPQVGCGSRGSHCVCPDPSPAEVSASSFQWDQVSSQEWPRPARGDLEAGGVCAEHSTVRA